MQNTTTAQAIRGGEFLLRDVKPEEVFIPEEWTEEQLSIAKMCHDFIDTQVMPQVPALDEMTHPQLMPELLTKAGQQGLLGVSVPEEFHGFGLDVNTSMLTTEILGSAHSFSVALLAHTGIGTLPILYFGTPDQKAHYLPKLATGEWKACYCLTEPGSGSDALGAKTHADLSGDGKHYILNGQKMWITNGGFADVLTVFAKVGGDKFTAFIVERGFGGITMNEEEKKMGIKGSSTRQIFFNDVQVPVENMLGEVGKGHRVAFNILNIGRLKLAAACLGSAKRTLNLAVKYATERVQFKQPIAQFGAIQHKLAQMAALIYATESATYRASNDIDMLEKRLLAEGKTYETSLLAAAEEFAAECSIMKVYGSEALDYVVDEGVQIYGGYGFSAEYPMDRAYRDSRINRIYEGTNEINRLLSINYLMGKALKGELDLLGAAAKLANAADDFTPSPNTGILAQEIAAISRLKKAVLLILSAAVQQFQQQLSKEQDVVMHLADMLIQLYVLESTVLRTQKLANQRGEAAVAGQVDATRILLSDGVAAIYLAGKDVVNALAQVDANAQLLQRLHQLTQTTAFNTIAARKRLAEQLVQKGVYSF